MEYTYVTSLQLNGSHVCSSGLFKKGFLLTTIECAQIIGIGIEEKLQKATAVLGDSSLRTRQRVDIVKIAYYDTSQYEKYEIGVVMVSRLEYFIFLII